LAQVLSPVRDHSAAHHPDLLVGIGTSDDAGAYALGDGRALVQTVDIFTPIVDSAKDWGRIAAVNALSDIYAMGATPLTALQYLAWPRGQLPFELASEVIAGGMDAMAEAGATVLGGHSIDAPEPTYGFAVTGLAPAQGLISNAGARAGDVLVLTKPLGIGIITTAIKRGKCPADLESRAIEVMSDPNRVAGEALRPHGATAATDVTGFGLLGHLREMAVASAVGATVRFDDVPVLDGALELLTQGLWPGGSKRNLESVLPDVQSTISTHELRLLVDAQTSGGLLATLHPDNADTYIAAVPGAVAIGEIRSDPGLEVVRS
jgi:selenide,water dikinase